MEGLKIVRVSVTPEACLDILTTGVEAGIYGVSSWAGRTGIKRTKKGLVREVTLTDLEADEQKKYTVTPDMVARAVGQLLRDPIKTDSVGWGSRLVLDDSMDGPLADAIIQIACFGKVIYG